MKLFRKTFVTAYILFIILIIIIFTIFSLNQIKEIKKSKIKQYDIIADVTAKEIMLGYMDSMWPFASLNDLIKREGCLFWLVIRNDGMIYLADKASFMGTNAYDHYPQLKNKLISNAIIIDRDVGIITKTLRMGEKNWSFCLGFSLADVSLMKKKIFLFNTLLFISALLVLALAMMIAMRHFAKPINELVAATNIIGKGDLAHRVNITSDDELGQLASAFNDMADKIQESDEKLTGIVNSIADPMSIIDQEYNIIWTNKLAQALLGPDLVGNKCYRTYYQREEPCEPCIGREVFHDGQIHEQEATVTLADGSARHFWCTANVARHYADGRPQTVIGIYRDITARKQAEEEVRQQRDQLRSLAIRLAEVEETERQNLARELHDQVCQKLAILSLSLETLKIRAQGEPVDQILSRLDDAADVVEDVGKVTRGIMAGLRPTVLDHYGLMGGLRHLGSQFSQRTGIDLEILGDEAGFRLKPNVELALFRIAQEALNNVAKHARASKVVLTMEVGQDTVRLVIADNGTGFDQNLVAKTKEGRGWGLMTMTERAMAVGGHCRIESQPGQGTRVIIDLVCGPSGNSRHG